MAKPIRLQSIVSDKVIVIDFKWTYRTRSTRPVGSRCRDPVVRRQGDRETAQAGFGG
jgi:hypothetical protein